jgi:hypothetical protein
MAATLATPVAQAVATLFDGTLGKLLNYGLSVGKGLLGAFSPLSLFASGEQGVWYDPSDFSTLFQDSAGTTPVTAVEQPVGKILDKSGRGNHATQATSASRPILARHPASGKRNLLLASDTMATQSYTTAAVAYTLSFTGTGTVDLSGAYVGSLAGTGASNRVSLTFTSTAASLTLTVTGSVTFAQLELGSTATAYQKTTTIYDTTEAGVADLHYLAFDGVDDALVTAAIDFTATNKVTLQTGANFTGSAVSRMLVEFSGNGYSTVGGYSFGQGLLAANSALGVLANTGSGVSAATALQTIPYKVVATASYDSSPVGVANELALRLNGAVEAYTTYLGTDFGTGNFGNHQLYIGARAAAAFFFIGNFYSLIIRGAASSASQIASAESYVNSKTGAY